MNAVFCDLYNFLITGEVSASLNANTGLSANHAGPSILILNDQGGSVMSVSEDTAATLRAQDHGHPPVICLNFQGSKGNNVVSEDEQCYSLNSMHGHDVHVVCFEPGIMSRDCSAGNKAYVDICSTLRAQMGDNQPAVCIPINLMVATRGGRDDMRTCFGVGDDGDPQFTLSSAHEHAVCYEVDNRNE